MTAPRGIGKEIQELRKKGLSYAEICEELECSKGTVSYHLGNGVKTKQQQYKKDNSTTDKIYKKICVFKAKQCSSIYPIITNTVATRIKNKIKRFKERGVMSDNFTYEDFMNKIGDQPKCYLTGDPIDISKTRSWHLDHRVPSSKGGDNSLENCEISSKDANQSKHDMTCDQFLELCEKVLVHNGYSVIK